MFHYVLENSYRLSTFEEEIFFLPKVEEEEYEAEVMEEDKYEEKKGINPK